MAVFDALHSRVYDAKASACAFDLLMLNGEDRRPYVERKAALRKILRHDKLLAAACKLGLEGIVSKKLDAPYKSGPSEAWLKIKNPNAPAATRAIDGQTPTWPRHIAAPRPQEVGTNAQA